MTPETPMAQRVRAALDAAPTSETARRLLEIDAVDVARAYLDAIAEVERLRNRATVLEIERNAAEMAREKLRADVGRLTRERDALAARVIEEHATYDALRAEVRAARGETDDARAVERETYATMRAIDAERCRLADEIDALRAEVGRLRAAATAARALTEEPQPSLAWHNLDVALAALDD